MAVIFALGNGKHTWYLPIHNSKNRNAEVARMVKAKSLYDEK